MRRDNRRPRRDSGSNEYSGGGFRSDFGFRGGNNFRQQREMHKATCSECGNECEVPFKPTEGRPVFCKECYAKNRPQRF